MMKRLKTTMKFLFTGKYPTKNMAYTKAEWEQYQKDVALNGQVREDGHVKIVFQPSRLEQ